MWRGWTAQVVCPHLKTLTSVGTSSSATAFTLLLNCFKFCDSVGINFATCCKEAWIQPFKHMPASGIWCWKWSLSDFTYRRRFWLSTQYASPSVGSDCRVLSHWWEAAYNAYHSVHSCKCLFARRLSKHSAQHFNISALLRHKPESALIVYLLGVAAVKSHSKASKVILPLFWTTVF